MKYNSTLRKLLLGSVAVLPALTVSFTSGAAPSNLVYSRSSQATAIDASGNVAYGPNNLALQSENISASPWTKINGSNTSGPISLSNGMQAYKLVEPNASTTPIVRQNSGALTAGATYYFSAIFLAAERAGLTMVINDGVAFRSVLINLQASTVLQGGTGMPGTTPQIVSLGGGFYQVYFYITPANSNAAAYFDFRLAGTASGATGTGSAYQGDGTSGLYITGAQLTMVTPAQTGVQPYLKTTSAAAYGPRFTYVNGAPAFLPEGATTNQIRNSTMQGAVVGDVELVSNTLSAIGGTTSLAGWTTTTANSGPVWTWNGSAAAVTPDGTNTAFLSIPFSVVSGQSYTLTFTYTGGTGQNAHVSTAINNGGSQLATTINNPTSGTATTQQFDATYTGTAYVTFWKTSANAGTLTSVSVRRTYVTNGDFALNPINAAQSTVQNGWSWSNSGGTMAAPGYTSGAVTIVGDGTATQSLDASITTVAGTTYTLTVDVTSGNTLTVLAGTAQGGATLLNSSATTTGAVFQFTASGTTTWLRFARTLATGCTFDNVRVRSAGVLPTNASYTNTTGIYWEVVGLGTESGLSDLDMRFFGTPTSGSSALLNIEGNTSVSATSGQAVTFSLYARQIAGTVANQNSPFIRIQERLSGGSSSTTNNQNIALPTGGLIGASRFQITATMGGATLYAQPYFGLSPISGNPVDTTVRLGGAQEEVGAASATSVLPTYGSTLTRAAEVAYLDVSGLGLSSAGYTVVQKGYMPADTASTLVLASGFDGSNNVGLNFYATGPTFTLSATDTGGATGGVNIASGLGAGAPYRFAVRVQAASVGAAVNGASGVTSTVLATPRLPTKLYLGYYGGNGTAYSNAPISSVTIYRTVMNDNQLLRAAA